MLESEEQERRWLIYFYSAARHYVATSNLRLFRVKLRLASYR